MQITIEDCFWTLIMWQRLGSYGMRRIVLRTLMATEKERLNGLSAVVVVAFSCSFQLKSGLYSKLSPNICFCQFLDYLSARIDIISFGPVMQVRCLNLASYRERSGFSQPNKPECGLSKVSAMRDWRINEVWLLSVEAAFESDMTPRLVKLGQHPFSVFLQQGCLFHNYLL